MYFNRITVPNDWKNAIITPSQGENVTKVTEKTTVQLVYLKYLEKF